MKVEYDSMFKHQQHHSLVCHAVGKVITALFQRLNCYSRIMKSASHTSRSLKVPATKEIPTYIVGIAISCPAFSSFIVRGVVGISVFSLYPWVGVVVIAIGWVFVFISPIYCSSSCSSLFEDAAKYDDEKKKQL